MKKVSTALALMAIAQCLIAANPTTLRQYTDHMSSLDDYRGRVTYSVLLPQAEDPVTYGITLRSSAADAGSMAPCRYLIEWEPGDPARERGFAAYIDGAHYRYRDGRLQEYHWDWDSIPFIMAGGGVQRNAQFTDVLPQFVGRELARLDADTNFVHTFTPDTIYNGRHVAILAGRLMYHGYVSKEAVYILDPATLMPLAIELENNPGSISEQSVSIRYTDHATEPFPLSSEEDLVALYPDVFEKYRENNFRIENLPGTLLPTFTAQRPGGGDRYAHHRGEGFENPVAILLLDETVATTPATIDAARKAAATSPTPFDIIYAFIGPESERVTDTVGRVGRGETLLTGARTLARDCGATAYPIIIYVDRTGRVADVTLGYTLDLPTLIIQTATLRL